MIFTPAPLEGAYIIDIEPREDARGFFARTWCLDEFAAHGLPMRVAQANLSYNRHKGTLRGMHFQRAPHAEAKVVQCARGALYDVVIDLRPDSPSFRRWFGVELSAASHRMLYVPEGFAHGFQTLADDTEVSYLISAPYAPAAAAGVRFDDPAFAIRWPLPVREISDKDRAWAYVA